MADPTPPWESSPSEPPAPWESAPSAPKPIDASKGSLSNRLIYDFAKNPDDFTIGGVLKNAGKSVLSEMKGGAGDLKDLVTGNSSKDEPAAQKEFKEKFDAGDATSADVKQLFLQGEGNSPGGKAMGASRLFPPIAMASSAMNNVVNPGIEAAIQYMGGDKENVSLAEQALIPMGMRAPKVDVLSKPLTKAATGIKNAVTHPIDTAGKALDATGKAISTVAKPVVKPIAMGMLESDNSMFGGGYKKALNSPTAKEGERLGKKLGVKFSGGELTGNVAARNVEDALANSAKYAEKFAKANDEKTDAIVGNFKKTLDEIHPKSVSRLDIGDRISTVYKNAIDNLVKTRRTQASSDFAVADKAAGGQPIIAPSNFIRVLKSYIKEGDSNIATPAQVDASNQAKSILKRLEQPVPKPSILLDQHGDPIKLPAPKESYKHITIDDLQNGLASFGDGAKSSGGIWKGLATASDRRFSKAAKAALEQDMDAASESGQGQAAAALKVARDNYRKNSNKISDIEKTTLGKLVGSSEYDSEGNIKIVPEKMADKFMSMEPSEIKNTLQFLDTHNPEVAKMARRYTLQSVLDKAVEGRGQRGEGSSKPFPKAKFVESLPSDAKLIAIMGSEKAASDVLDVSAALNRMIDYGAQKKGSQTAQRTNILEGLVKWGKGALYRSIASDSLAEDLLDPTRRKELVAEAKKNNTP